MNRSLAAGLVGLLFGTGIAISGMANPAKVLNFFDVAGAWDPSLAFVMAGALVVTAIGYRLVLRRPAPLLEPKFHLPTSRRIDLPLVAGSAVFGIGWGISGFCPGGAIPALGLGEVSAWAFVVAMLAGIALARAIVLHFSRARSRPPDTNRKESLMPTIPFTPDLSLHPEVTAFFDAPTNTISYVVRDPASNACAVVDSVMDIDYAAGRITYDGADRIIAFIRDHGLSLEWLIETHVHADHLSAAPYIQGKLGGRLGIGENITLVQETFGKIFNEGTEFQRDGSQFDRLFKDGDTYTIGTMTAHVMHTPGHTPACMTHVIGDAAFVGDTLFMPDGGSARADFPGGDARTLYRSIQRVLALPRDMRLFMCHDYGPNGRDIQWETTVGDEIDYNIHVGGGTDEDTFVKMREARDATLAMPKLIIPSLQVNMRAGQLPPRDEDGRTYLKVPVNGL